MQDQRPKGSHFKSPEAHALAKSEYQARRRGQINREAATARDYLKFTLNDLRKE